MAQARAPSAGGFTAVHVWMIGFVFLWLTSTVLLVWLYTAQEDLKSTNEELQGENQRLARAAEKSSLRWYTDASESGPSMVGLLEEDRKQTAMIAVGQEIADAGTVRGIVKPFFEEIRRDGIVEDVSAFESIQLLPAMKVLYEEFRGEHELRGDAEARATQADEALRETVETQQALQAEFDATTDDLKGQIARLERERADYAAERDKQVNGFDQRLDDLKQEHSRELQAKNNEIADLRQRYTDLLTRHEELREKLGELQIKPGERITARTGDGRVIKAVPGDQIIYVDLGRAHQLTPGLQFAVYPSSGIPLDGRPKGRIEVTRIHDVTAECRILAVDPRDIILEGDIIANPVYDPSRSLRFVVVGEFDLNGDGRRDAQGAEQIKAIITEWGGRLADQLSTEVDFVVAGAAPVVPETVSGSSTLDRGTQERDRMLQHDRDEYDGVIAAAQNLSIPILTQDVFLRFLGY